jgi:hypothetical protein
LVYKSIKTVYYYYIERKPTVTKVAKHLDERIAIAPQWDDDLEYLASFIVNGSVTSEDYEFYLEELSYCLEISEEQVYTELHAYLIENYVERESVIRLAQG